MRRRGGGARAALLAVVLLLAATALSGCALFPLGQPPVPPVTDETPVGSVPKGEVFGTQVALGATPLDSITRARTANYVAARTVAVTAMLDARAKAVTAHDEKAFLATVDPTDPAFVAQQRQLFANLALLPLASYALRVTDRYGVAPPASRTTLGVPVFLPVVAESYQLKDFDTGPVGRSYAMTLLQRGGRWLLASTSDRPDTPPLQDPWDGGPIAVDTRGTVLLVSSGLTAAQRSDALGIAAQAVTDDQHYLPSWNGRAVLYLSTDRTLFDRLFDTGTDGHAAASYAAAEVPQHAYDDPAAGVTGTRVLVNPTDLGKLGDTDRTSAEAVTFRHELTHVALATEVGPARPLWLTEGVAQWVAYAPFPFAATYERQQRRAAIGGTNPPGVPDDDRFTTGDDDALDAAYSDAWLVCQDVVDHEGAAALLAAYAAVSALPATAVVSQPTIDGALQSTLHLTEAQLSARYVADLRAP